MNMDKLLEELRAEGAKLKQEVGLLEAERRMDDAIVAAWTRGVLAVPINFSWLDLTKH